MLTKLQKIDVRIPQELKEEIKKISEETSTGYSESVRVILKLGLIEYKKLFKN